MPTRLLLVISDFQVNVDNGGGNGVDGDQLRPDATALNDGRFVIAYQSDFFGSATNQEAVFRVLGSSDDYTDAFNTSLFQGQPAVAPRADGGFGIVFTNQRHADVSIDTNPNNITYVRVL